jgi:outer membrane protein insertion porin family
MFILTTSNRLDQAVPYRWYNLVDPRKTARPYLFANTVLLHPNDVYSRTTHNNSLNRFINLGPYQYVKTRFEDVTPDSPKLDIYYFLTPYKRKSLQLELLGRTTSASYTGSQINLNWKNRNAFKGGELLTVTLFASTDVQVGGQSGGYNVYQYGIQPSISWPRIIGPFNFKSDNAYIPRTTLTLNYTSVVRSKLYSLNSFSGSFGYQFKSNVHKLNELNLLEITYVKPRNVSQIYIDSIKKSTNPALQHVIDPQFTWGPSYAYTYDNTTEDYRTNSYFYRGKLSLSNNIYGLVTGADTLGGKVKTLFGTPFNQYLKLENEIRFFHKLSAGSKFATRFLVGVGLPYGNSTILPYNQQFFIGGPNSLRGFRARSIGPGTVDASSLNNGFIADQSGDIKFEANVEYRAKLFSIVYGALFADAGNVWNYKAHQVGGTFGPKFLSQLAVDAGFGLRFDATVLVLRTDLGFPLMRPYPVNGSRSISPSFNNAILNIAIGYPF